MVNGESTVCPLLFLFPHYPLRVLSIYHSPFTIYPNMKAVVITAQGGPEVLEVRDVEPPELSTPNSIRVKVRAASLNRADLLQRRGLYPAPPGDPQDIPGMQFAGEVEKLGSNVTQWKRSKEHTSELQSPCNLVCRLPL